MFPLNLSDNEMFTGESFGGLLKEAKLPYVFISAVVSGGGKFVHFFDMHEYMKYFKSKFPADEPLPMQESGLENPVNRQQIDMSYVVLIDKKDKFFYAFPRRDHLHGQRTLLSLSNPDPKRATRSGVGLARSFIRSAELALQRKEEMKVEELNLYLAKLLVARKLLNAAVPVVEAESDQKIKKAWLSKIARLLPQSEQLLKEIAGSANLLYLQQALAKSAAVIKE